MRKIVVAISCWLLAGTAAGQTISQQLQKAYGQFENDSQLKHAISSLYVIDAKTGQVVFDKNSRVGLAPASTQKIFTAASAFALLGKEYRYKTEFGMSENEDKYSLWIKPSGDPTLGSWRWEQTKGKNTLDRIITALKKTGRKINWPILVYAGGWNAESTPDGWIWQDIGNYYGAGPGVLNWRENQYDLFLKSTGKAGDPVTIVSTDPVLHNYALSSLATAGKKGTGDNAYVYFDLSATNQAVVRGTIPVDEDHFVISGAMAAPQHEFLETLIDSLKKDVGEPQFLSTITFTEPVKKNEAEIIHTEFSPSLDSIIYCFQKSFTITTPLSVEPTPFFSKAIVFTNASP